MNTLLVNNAVRVKLGVAYETRRKVLNRATVKRGEKALAGMVRAMRPEEYQEYRKRVA